MSYWRLHYHSVWACKNRQSLVTPDIETSLYNYFRGKCSKLDAVVHAVGGIENHVHLVFSLHPKYSVADFIGKIKGASSHWVTHVLQHPDEFDWQRGYGVLSISERILPKVISYVVNQKDHHLQNRIEDSFERWSEDEEGVMINGDD